MLWLIRRLERLTRFLHHVYAEMHGYFWRPCPTCKQYFGGHEIVFERSPPTGCITFLSKPRYASCPRCNAALEFGLRSDVTADDIRRVLQR